MLNGGNAMQERGPDGSRHSTCTVPAIGSKLYDYHNEALSKEETRVFEEHLALCPACQKSIAELDWILETLAEGDVEVASVQ
jgi:hypothetical protein